MKFEISSSRWWNNRIEVLDKYPLLIKKYQAEIISYKLEDKDVYGKDVNNQAVCVEIRDLERLLEFYNDFGQIVILAPFHNESPCEYAIEIYDGYRE